MSSGQKRVVYNPRERAISSDLNRAQSFAAADAMEAWRLLMTGNDGEHVDGGSSPFFPNITHAPLDGRIINGFRVVPQLASANTIVGAGVAMVVDPDATPSADDSVFKLVNDPGVPDGSTLLLTPNTSGSTRIDVVECQRVETVVETSSRDIFNPASGLFAPALVNKVIASRFRYQIRAGVPGGGLPAPATGWMPLMVAKVPTGTTTWDTCDCWDVRPLVTNALYNLSDMRANVTPRGKCRFTVDGSSSMVGVIETGFYSQRCGGVLWTGSDSSILLTSSEVQEAGYAGSSELPVYLYAMFPNGWHRWVKYQDAPSSRTPRGMRGIPVLSTKPPTAAGYTSANVVMPTALGFGVTGQTGVLLTSLMAANGGTVPQYTYADDKVVSVKHQFSSMEYQVNAGTFNANSATFTITEGVDFPAGAKAIRAKFYLTAADGGSGASASNGSEITADGVARCASHAWNYNSAGHNGMVLMMECRIPLSPAAYPGSPIGATHTIQWDYGFGASGLTVGTAPQFSLDGWED